MLEVSFSVQVKTKPCEAVYVVGDCGELGGWNPEKATALTRSEENLDVWAVTVEMAVAYMFEYRFFVAIKYSQATEHYLMVQSWETNIHPRLFRVSVLPPDQKSVDLPVAQYGHYGGQSIVDKGWLTGQTEVRLSLHSNPVEMWKHCDRQQSYQIKCSTMDLRYKDMLSMDSNEVAEGEEEDTHQDDNLTSNVYISVLNGIDDEPAEQAEFGTLYHSNDYFIFKAQSFNPQYVGYQFDFYLHHRSDPAPPYPKLMGSAYVLPVNLTNTSGRKVMPINGSSNRPIGQLTVEYLIVKPMSKQLCDMRVSYSRKWKHTRRPLDVGHRGLGSTYNMRECSTARENTIESLSEAIAHGADYVEFDVHLSKDLVPVIYHDFNVCLTLRQKQSDDIEYFEIPVGDLNMKQLQMLQVEHVSEKLKDPSERQSMCTLPLYKVDPRQQPFPSLRQCFEQIDEIAGFNIEVKYPLLMQTGEMEEGMLNLMDLNVYLDVILAEILQYASKRMIVISCFNPDACLMMRLKQNRYPVIFLCQGANDIYPPYDDIRTRSLQNSFSFARAERLLGVAPFSAELLQHVEMISWAKKFGLVIFTWGEMNNNMETIDELKSLGVDAVIFDRIHEIKSRKENVFKMELNAKLDLLKTVGAISALTSDSAEDFSVSSSPVIKPVLKHSMTTTITTNYIKQQ